MDPVPGTIIKIAALCGSITPVSVTRRVMEIALLGAAETGAETVLLDLRDYDLPFAGARGADAFPDVQRLALELRSAQGILWGTPEYHGSYTGVLKNALDLMGEAEFQGKMIGLVGVAGGAIGAINALSHLRTVGRQLHAWVLPQQVSVSGPERAFGTDGNLLSVEIEQRLKELGREVARFARLHSTG